MSQVPAASSAASAAASSAASAASASATETDAPLKSLFEALFKVQAQPFMRADLPDYADLLVLSPDATRAFLRMSVVNRTILAGQLLNLARALHQDCNASVDAFDKAVGVVETTLCCVPGV
jgi:hypothetical protein